jgi:hypothetical protein
MLSQYDYTCPFKEHNMSKTHGKMKISETEAKMHLDTLKRKQEKLFKCDIGIR